MCAVKRSTEKERHWTAWSGTAGDLRRLADLVDSLGESRKVTILAQYNGENDANQHPETQDMIQRLNESFVARCTITDGDDRTTGQPGEIIEEIDRRTVTSIEFALMAPATHRQEKISIMLKRNTGVALNVSSHDQGWGRQAFAQLSDEIDKGVPKWSWVHRDAGVFLLFALTAFLVVATFWASIPINFSKVVKDVDEGGYGIESLLVIIPIILVLTVINQGPIRKWFFPPFEIFSDGGSGSTGSRRLAYAMGVMLSVPVGILVNLIS